MTKVKPSRKDPFTQPRTKGARKRRQQARYNVGWS